MLHHHIIMDDDIVFVSVLYYPIWPKRMLESLRKYCNNQIILVDHLLNDNIYDYADKNSIVISNPCGKNYNGHGGGLDAAVQYLRDHGKRWFIHIEPDCIVWGRKWYDELFKAAQYGMIMAGPNKLSYGPIHPCPSIWDISRIHGSFAITQIDEHVDESIYHLAQYAQCLQENPILPNDGITYLLGIWDCGIRNWYEAEKLGLAAHTSGDGITHHTEGRFTSSLSSVI